MRKFHYIRNPPLGRAHPERLFDRRVGEEKRFIFGQKLLQVSPQDRFLQVEVTPDNGEYKPREKARYTIKTTDAGGKPVSAEVSLSVVDEAIYAISEEMVPEIKRFFYGKRPNLVATTTSFVERYFGGAKKEAREKRGDFRDTAYWNPTILTDENGEAKVELQLPDNLTTWRATARAHTLETSVGSGVNKVLARKKLLARLALPRFFVEGDTVSLGGIVHNSTGTKR